MGYVVVQKRQHAGKPGVSPSPPVINNPPFGSREALADADQQAWTPPPPHQQKHKRIVQPLVTTGPVLDTYIYQNKGGSPTDAETHWIVGMSFKKGDVPSGSRLAVERQDTHAALTYQADLRTTFSDGSLKFASVWVVLPSIGAGANFPVDVRAEIGSFNNVTTRTVVDITGAHDWNIHLTELLTYLAVQQGGGAWTAKVNDAIAAGYTVTRSGPCGMEIETSLPFHDDGIPANLHSEWIGTFHARILTKQSNGSVAGFVVYPIAEHGNLTIASTRYTMLVDFRDGSTVIRGHNAGIDNRKVVSSIALATDQLTVPAHGITTGTEVRCSVTAGGTMPNIPVTYLTEWAGHRLFWRSIDANTGSLHTSAAGAVANTGRVDITVTFAGTMRIVAGDANPWTTRNSGQHSGFAILDTEGLPEWIGVTRPNINVQRSATYLRSTGLIPYYDLTVVPSPATNASPPDYIPGSQVDCDRDFGSVGERAEIGLLPNWCVLHLLSQDSGYLKQCRSNAHIFTYCGIRWRNEVSGKIPTVHTTVYVGMGASKSTSWVGSAGTHSGDIPNYTGGSTTDGVQDDRFRNQNDNSHWPNLVWYTYLMEGEVWWLRSLIYEGNFCLLDRNIGATHGARNKVINGNSHSCLIIHTTSQIRSDAWGTLHVAQPACIIPDDWPEKPYFVDASNENYSGAVDYIAIQVQAFRDLGLWDFNCTNNTAPYMNAYLFQSMNQQARLLEQPANLMSWINHHKTYIKGMCGDPPDGTYCAAWLQTDTMLLAPEGTVTEPENAAYYTTWAQIGSYTKADITFAIGTVFTLVDTSGFHTVNGDAMIRFTDHGAWPTGFAADTPYYVVNRSGNNLGLAAIPGGAALASDIAGARRIYVRPPAGSCTLVAEGSAIDAWGRYRDFQAALRMGIVNGITGLTTAEANLAPYCVQSMSAKPKYAMAL